MSFRRLLAVKPISPAIVYSGHPVVIEITGRHISQNASFALATDSCERASFFPLPQHSRFNTRALAVIVAPTVRVNTLYTLCVKKLNLAPRDRLSNSFDG